MRLVLALFALTTTGCQGDDPVDPPLPPPGLGPVAVAVIKPDSATIAPGDTVRLRIVSVNGNPPDRATWGTSDTTVAVVDSLGLVTGRRVGDVSIRGTGYRGTMVGFAAVPIKVR